ncbi:MAG: hypothetical protein U1F41_03155 [Burkholderiales bacterium]
MFADHGRVMSSPTQQEVSIVSTQEKKPSKSRREFVKKAAYVAPAIATMKAAPSFAKAGSDKSPKPSKPPMAETN